MLTTPSNKFSLLTELYLYMNYIEKMPILQLASLRVLNLNRNQELKQLRLGYCPLLEQFSASYCQLSDMGSLKNCPNLIDLDVSFNHLPTLKEFLDCLPHKNFSSLSFNDNKFSAITDGEAMYVPT
jgi:Leucine-rich repeat (LRR) protein